MDAIKRKIRSLLTLAAPGSGATDPERATAKSMADKLLAQHGLRESEIPLREVERRPPPPPVVEIVIHVGGFRQYGAGFSFGGFGFGNGTNTTNEW